MLNSINPSQILGLLLFFTIIGLIVIYKKYITASFEIGRLQRLNKDKTETIKSLKEDISNARDRLSENRHVVTLLKKFLFHPPVAIAKGVIKKVYTMKIDAPSVRVHHNNKTSNINGILLYENLGNREYISADKIKGISKTKEEDLFEYLKEHLHSEKYWIDKSHEDTTIKRGIRKPRNRE